MGAPTILVGAGLTMVIAGAPVASAAPSATPTTHVDIRGAARAAATDQLHPAGYESPGTAQAVPYPIPHIKSMSSRKCVSVLGWSKSKGAHIVQWSCYNGRANNQQFQVRYYGTWKGVKEVQIMNMHSRLCLSVAGKSTRNGAYVNQWSCNGADNTLWAIYKANSTSYVFQNMWSGKCLDVAGNSMKNGAWLTQYTCGRYKNEDFIFPVTV